MLCRFVSFAHFFFFNDTATTEIYTLSLHDALPICLDHAEEVYVLRIGPGPPAFDEVGAQFVQLLGDHDLVLGRERDVLGLRAVAQGGVVDFDWARVVRFHLTLSPIQRPRAGPGSLSLNTSPRSRRRS